MLNLYQDGRWMLFWPGFGNKSSKTGHNSFPGLEYHQWLFDPKIGTIKTFLPLTESKRQNNGYRMSPGYIY